MGNWTPEPWPDGAPFDPVPAGDVRLLIAGEPPRADLRLVAEGNFQRARACVNALAGLNPEAVGEVVKAARDAMPYVELTPYEGSLAAYEALAAALVKLTEPTP